MTTLAAAAIRRPLGPIILALVLAGFGLMALFRLSMADRPASPTPILVIDIAEPGASAADLMESVAGPVEAALSALPGIGPVTSRTSDGHAVTAVTVQAGTDPAQALGAVRDAVARLRLPQEAGAPRIGRLDDAPPAATYALTSPTRSLDQLTAFADEVVAPALRRLPGVGRIERLGGAAREIDIRLDPDRLQAFHLTGAEVGRQLAGTRADSAAGGVGIGDGDQPIRVIAAARTIGDLAASPIMPPGGVALRLDDLGEVSDALADEAVAARLGDQAAVALRVDPAPGIGGGAAAAAIAETLRAIGDGAPDVVLTRVAAASPRPFGTGPTIWWTLLGGAVLAASAAWLGLRDGRAALMALGVPALTILSSLAALRALGLDLGPASLAALVVAAGLVTGDAIVAMDAVLRHRALGKPVPLAALDAAGETARGAVAVTMLTIAFCVPLLLGAGGIVPRAFAVALVIPLLFSLLASHLLVPALASLGPGARPVGAARGRTARLADALAGLTAWSARRAAVTVSLGLAAFGLVLLGAPALRSGPAGAGGADSALIGLELPPGTTLARTAGVAAGIAQAMRRRPDIATILVLGGEAPSRLQADRFATLVVGFAPGAAPANRRDWARSIDALLRDMPDLRVWFADARGTRDLSLAVTGQDGATVRNVAAELAAQLGRLPALTRIAAGGSLDRAELHIRPRPPLVARAGLTAADLAQTVRFATLGERPAVFAWLGMAERPVPVRIGLDEGLREEPQRLAQLRVPLPEGRGSVPLDAVAEIGLEAGPSELMRRDGAALASVEADLAADVPMEAILAQIAALPAMQRLPPGVAVGPTVDAGVAHAATGALGEALGAGAVLAIVALVLTFGSPVQPLVLVACLPLSLGGALLGLIATRLPLGLPALLAMAFVALVVARHAVLLLLAATRLIVARKDPTQAVALAGREALRPMLTAAAVVAAALLPTALLPTAAPGLGAEIAVTAATGLLAAVPLTLLFVPAAALLVYDAWRFGRRLLARSPAGSRPVPPRAKTTVGGPHPP